jgi:hypothetical protein
MRQSSSALFKSFTELAFAVAALSATERAWGQEGAGVGLEPRGAPGRVGERLSSITKTSPKLSAVLDAIDQSRAASSGVYLNPAHRLARVATSKDLSEIIISISNQGWITQERALTRLGLTVEQQQQLSSVQERAARLVQDWSDLILIDLPQLQASQRPTTPHSASFDTEQFVLEKRVELFELRSAEIRAEVGKILSPIQLRMLSQYENRSALLQYGAEQALQGVLGIELALSPTDHERIKAVCQSLSGEVIARTERLTRRQGDETFACLTAQQVEQIRSLLGDWTSLAQPLPELLVLQLREVEKGDTQALDLVAEWGRYERGWAANSLGDLERLQSASFASPSALLQLATTPLYGRVPQWGAAPTEDVLTKFNEWLVPVTSDDSGAQRGAVLGRLAKEELQRDLTTVLEPLTEVQREQLEVVLLRRLVALRGLVTSCLNGNLGKKLALTESQREQVRALAAKHLDEVISESYALEQEIWEAVLKELSPQQSSCIREQCAISLEDSAGAPVLLLMALTVPARVK